MSFASTSTEFAMIDTRTTSGAFVLPLTTDIPGRIINIKDAYGTFTNSSLTVYTQGGEAFEDGTNFRVLNNSWDQLQVYTASTTRWYITGGTEQNITATNISVVSTLQTFNWPSLCNTAGFGYGSTFNPTALGKISFLDNVFTSSTAGLASTFIEMGNLNAQPTIMSTGGAFRWLMGVEPDVASMGRGLQFKIKRWNSFGFSNSATFYGANQSTLTDSLNIDSRGFVGINCNAPLYQLDVNGETKIGASTFIFGPNNGTARLILGPSPGGQNFDYCSLIQSCNAFATNFGSELSFWTHGTAQTNADPTRAMTINSAQNVGVGCNTPAFTLDVRGQTRINNNGSNLILQGATGAGVTGTLGIPGNSPSSLTITWGDGSGWYAYLRGSAGRTTNIMALRDSDGFVGINNNNPAYQLHVNGAVGISNVATGYGHLKLFPTSASNEAAIGFYSTTTEVNTFMWMAGRSANFGTMGNFGIVPIISGGVNTAIGTIFTPTGQVGINCNAPIYNLDVNGIGRTRIIISTLTTNPSFAANSFGTYYNLSNTGITGATLPALTAADNGWFVVLRNNTPVTLNMAWSGTTTGLPASSNTIPASNSLTLAWNGSAYIYY